MCYLISRRTVHGTVQKRNAMKYQFFSLLVHTFSWLHINKYELYVYLKDKFLKIHFWKKNVLRIHVLIIYKCSMYMLHVYTSLYE